MSYQTEVLEYFHKKAAGYDRVEDQVYWRLSDILLWELLDSHVLSKLPPSFRLLDAGGGTGRWTEKTLLSYPHASALLRDISPAMIAEAHSKAVRIGVHRWTISEGNIETMSDLEEQAFDLVINLHNVIGFVEDPLRAILEMKKRLKPGGFLVTVAPNYYHMAFFNLYLQRVEVAERTLTAARGAFTSDMPEIHVFTPDRLKALYEEAGIGAISVFGFPILNYPGFQETQLTGSSHSVTSLLDPPDNFEQVLRMERSVLSHQEAAARGNNLFTIGQVS